MNTLGAPNLAGGLQVGACDPHRHCPAFCDPKYLPQCTNDCFEQGKCCPPGSGSPGDGGGSCGIGSAPTGPGPVEPAGGGPTYLLFGMGARGFGGGAGGGSGPSDGGSGNCGCSGGGGTTSPGGIRAGSPGSGPGGGLGGGQGGPRAFRVLTDGMHVLEIGRPGPTVPPCTAVPGLPAPLSVPDSSSPYFQDVLVTSSNSDVGGVIVTCKDTGVSKVYSCGSGQQRFYFRATGRVTYTVPANTGFRCIDGSVLTSGASTPGFVPQQTNVGIALS